MGMITAGSPLKDGPVPCRFVIEAHRAGLDDSGGNGSDWSRVFLGR